MEIKVIMPHSIDNRIVHPMRQCSRLTTKREPKRLQVPPARRLERLQVADRSRRLQHNHPRSVVTKSLESLRVVHLTLGETAKDLHLISPSGPPSPLQI